ncbi:LANO_0G13784g1_1 [Lachancea nothofagi CBS 11611]|uniref:LANO_0G13784g1_1 n=1 Tax=Lachancea nothofagi CBS 11611 TaxID=1266666 RepID=A0A1G4KK89_9SACH|nr:LANO_0G13784g1_1 [Lachancea nothofagi CBS 11611]
MTSQALSIEDARKVIISLEKQLEELECTSNEYEVELEGVIQKLETQMLEKDELIESLKRDKAPKNIQRQIASLEIRADELENENRSLRCQLRDSQTENDALIEQNVLLQHEVSDLNQRQQEVAEAVSMSSASRILDTLKIESPTKPNNVPRTQKRTHLSNVLRVNANQSSLRLSSFKEAADNHATHVSTTSVVSTTSYK